MELRISEVMKIKGVNIETLKNNIEHLGGNTLSRTSISKIINGVSSPKVDTLNLIAKGLDVDIRELFKSPEGINGFVDYNGKLHRITSEEDLRKLLNEIESNTE